METLVTLYLIKIIHSFYLKFILSRS